jgi:hypothetical protein
MENEFLKDGGYKSRKFVFGIICLVSIVVAGVICPAAIMPEVVAGVIGVCGIYVTGNVINRVKGAFTFAQPTEEEKAVDSKAEKPTKVEPEGE